MSFQMIFSFFLVMFLGAYLASVGFTVDKIEFWVIMVVFALGATNWK